MAALRLVKDGFTEPVPLAEGITYLERGGPCPDLIVDLGGGDFASANGPLREAGLAQRLLGHRLLLALAGDPPSVNLDLPDRRLDISADVRELLDLVRPTG